MRRRLTPHGLAVVTAAAAAALTGCGGDDDGSATAGTGAAASTAASGSGGGTLHVSADPGGALRFEQAKLETEAGTTTVTFENASGVPHAVEIEGNGIEEETETITDGRAELTVDLKPGTYEFYCPVGNHEAAGMKGELTVR